MSLIKEAALNTLLGMGMTFLVLISLSLIITLFGKVLSGGFGKAKSTASKAAPKATPKAEPETKQVPAETAAEPEVIEAPQGEDLALMAVISAAVAAYEDGLSPEIVAVIAAAVAAAEGGKTITGTPGASGFAARKIRKSRKHVA